MQLYIIRHAQSENNALWSQTGSSNGRSPDPTLTELGHKQAQAVAAFLAQPSTEMEMETAVRDNNNREGFGLTHLYASLMERAVLTATYIAQAVELPLFGLEMIHEWGGIYTRNDVSGEKVGLPGSNRAYFSAQHPDLILPDFVDETGWWNRPPEPREERVKRAQRFWQFLQDRHGDADDRVAIVTHGGFIQSLLSALLGFSNETAVDQPQEVWFATNNVSVSRIDLHSDHIRIVYMNRVDFLPDGLIT